MNLLTRKRIGLGTQISLLPKHEKKVFEPSNLMSNDVVATRLPSRKKKQYGGHHITFHNLGRSISWPLDCFFSLGDLVATKSFHTKV
jgi:hypothetical protein